MGYDVATVFWHLIAASGPTLREFLYSGQQYSTLGIQVRQYVSFCIRANGQARFGLRTY